MVTSTGALVRALLPLVGAMRTRHLGAGVGPPVVLLPLVGAMRTVDLSANLPY